MSILECQVKFQHDYFKCKIAGRTKKIPHWLISFAALFIPICFTTSKLSKEKSRQRMKK